MTVFSAPLSLLPNGGLVRRPDVSADAHQTALAGLAVIEDEPVRRARAEAYARRAHDALNAPLRTTAEQMLATLGIAEAGARTAIARHRDGLATEDDVKAVISADRVVPRDRVARAVAIISTLLIVTAYVVTEAKLLGQVVMTSGVLGLLPDSFWDQVFAYAFAGFPVAYAVKKYCWYGWLKTAAEREADLRRINWLATRIGFPAWVVAVVFLFGPNLVPAGGAMDDPFAVRPALSGTISVLIRETQAILQDLSPLLAPVLIFGVLVGASNLTAAIWISQRESATRAQREDVRPTEGHVFRNQALDGLITDQVRTDASTGPLRGLVEAIAADCDAFVEQVCHEIEACRTFGELARRTTILKRVATQGQVIDAVPLFTRR